MREKKQHFHLEPPRGLLNDPNGLSYFNGKYYVFFQWNRFVKDHSYKEWGMFTSPDMVRWTFEGSALLPDQTYDMCGVYSGSGLVIDEKLYLFYTGNVKKGGKRKSHQCMAVTENGQKFLKLGSVAETPEYFTEHFRDPKVFRTESGTYFMVTGAQRKSGKGALALFRSGDGLTWEYSGIPAVTEEYEMVECPDLFPIDGTYVLLYCPQRRDNEKDTDISSFSAVKTVRFNEREGTFDDADLDQNFSRTDFGFDFYAPQTFEAPDGRRILYAWMSRMDGEQEEIFSRGDPRIHCLTLPREFKVTAGKLIQTPVKELEQLKGAEVPPIRCEDGTVRLLPGDRTFFLHFTLPGPGRDVSVRFHSGESSLTWVPEAKQVRFTRKNWVTGKTESRECRIERLREVEIWSDQSSMEIFLNGGEAVMSSRIFPEDTAPGVVIKGLSANEAIQMNEINGGKKDVIL
ncbi:glycoside hydrolase family 32 protein [Mediterraneibacter glycyrrhizinilyticus]|uniref:glycoside hydrolase family 32 protein n=1 Tax=Mediterraneibacter glycyrrhizinilyticus TaxID=342942 RepID=UPI00195F7BAC|nr:glycoside hydrolase family 32 protein [Mediterraneibacter glycyrrhizinilyticus]MBM6751571.1 glycoside hydrolase family 32 protein [Mediterraneibacter glycyrrhizinilyticus]